MLNTLYTCFPTHLVTKRLSLVSIGYALTMLACVEAAGEDRFAMLWQYIPEKHQETIKQKLKNKLTKPQDQELHQACKDKHYPKMKSLITKGANVNTYDNKGERPLLHVVRWQETKDKKQALDLLIQYKADVNAQNEDFKNGLHIACFKQYVDTAYFLMLHGIDYTRHDIVGNTPLHTACYHNNTTLVMVLTSVPNIGTLLQTKNKNQYQKGQTPREIAKKKGHNKIVALLDAQAALSNKHLVATAGLTRENSSHVIDAIVHLIVSYLLFKGCSTT